MSVPYWISSERKPDMLHRSFNRTDLIDECRLELNRLLVGDGERCAFTKRFTEFCTADPFLPQLTELSTGALWYRSESFVPPNPRPSKPNLFLVVGNPAPESVSRGAMYAYEGAGTRQHRFWKVLHLTGIVCFSDLEPDTYSPAQKMQRLYTGQYNSPFNVYIIPFFSLSSPPGGPWGGVAGLQRLFGRHFTAIIAWERAAVRRLIDGCARGGDTVMTLQKDAYRALKSVDAPDYDAPTLRKSPLVSEYAISGVQLVCIPPTRLLYSQVTRLALLSLHNSA